MSTRRKLIKTLLLTFVFSLALISTSLPSFAGDNPDSDPVTDWRLSGVVTTNNEILEGDSVTYLYEIKNVGNATSYIGSPIGVFTPVEFTFVSYSVPTNFACESEGVLSADEAGPATWAIGRFISSCYSDAADMPEWIYLDPGESIYFEITGIANADYTINSTSYSMYTYEVDPELFDPFKDGENIWLTNSSDVLGTANYPYGVAQSQVSTTTAKPVAGVQGNAVEVASGDPGGDEIGRTRSSVGSSVSGFVAPSKANETKASAIKDPKQKGLEPDEPPSWSEIFERYNLEITGGLAFLIVFATSGMILFRRYKRKTQSQREYRHAISLLKHQKRSIQQESDDGHNPKKTIEQKPKNLIERTKLFSQPVEMDTGVPVKIVADSN